MNPFMIYALLAAALAVVWARQVLAAPRPRRLRGVIGAWAGAVVLIALWRADSLPWLWVALQGVLFVWLLALVAILLDAVAAWRVEEERRRFSSLCAWAGVAVHAAAGLHFMWLATVSPGGV